MPLYDYRCENGHRYEEREPFGSPSTQACRRCKSPAHRVLSVPAITFKGSGWYKTDSRGTNAARATSGSADGDTSTEGNATRNNAKENDSTSGSQTDDSGSQSNNSGKDKSTRAGKNKGRSNKTANRSGESADGN